MCICFCGLVFEDYKLRDKLQHRINKSNICGHVLCVRSDLVTYFTTHSNQHIVGEIVVQLYMPARFFKVLH